MTPTPVDDDGSVEVVFCEKGRGDEEEGPDLGTDAGVGVGVQQSSH